MGILSGALTVRRYRVIGELPEGWRDTFRTRLGEHAFRDPVGGAQGKEEIEGWVQVHNLLDTEFTDFNRWLYTNFAVFALRVDKKALPARLVTATVLKRCDAWKAERGVERVPAAVKKQIKEDLEKEWLARTLPRVSTIECCWNVNAGWLLLGSHATAASDRFRKRFLRTFGLKLAPFSPLDWVGEAGQGLLDLPPSRMFQGGASTGEDT